jgi:hypothetical protein
MPDGARPALYGMNEGMRDEGEQKPEAKSQKKRESVNAVLSPFILASGF